MPSRVEGGTATLLGPILENKDHCILVEDHSCFDRQGCRENRGMCS